MIKVDKRKFSCDGTGRTLLSDLYIAVKAVADTLGVTTEFVLEELAYALKEADEDETNLC